METQTIKIEDRISYISNWFLNSGIQSGEGGFYGWEDAASGKYSYLYSEITGYALTMLCFLYAATKDDIFIKKAEAAAGWIIDKAMHPEGGVLTRDYVVNENEHYSFKRGNIYAFDCGMVAFGLLKLYQVRQVPEYLNTAKGIILFLEAKMLGQDNLFYPIYDAKNNKAYSDNAKWSKQSGSFHCKLALCLSELAAIEEDHHYKNMALNLIEASVKSFYDGARFITNLSDASSHLHPFAYTIEGMLYYAHKFGDNRFSAVAHNAFKWLLQFQGRDGRFPTSVFGKDKIKISFHRSDIQAQILRLYYLFSDNKEYANFNADRLFAGLLDLQSLNGAGKGSFRFGFDEDGSKKDHNNSWCGMFALQALCLLKDKAYKELVMEYLI